MLISFPWRKCSPIVWIFKRDRRLGRMMDLKEYLPPEARGMTVLDRSVFQKSIRVPKLKVEAIKLLEVLPIVKEKMLKLGHLKAVSGENVKTVLLNPGIVKSWEDVKGLEQVKVSEDALIFEEIEINYENFKYDEIFRAVFPEDQENLTSFSRIGHIVHVNLKEHLLPFRRLIGEVFLDKVPGCRTVVNKIHTIESKFRNFEMELLAGRERYQVEVKENGCIFELDFNRVYWNPRLASEHERIVKSLTSGHHFCDVFAGVGPFSIPAAKKECRVLANDLNPDSINWLKHNAKRNKVEDSIEICNKDGREFILNDFKNHLVEFWHQRDPKKSLTVVMNLPALAIEFLDVFSGLLSDQPELQAMDRTMPLVHVYTFLKGGAPEDARTCAESHLGHKITDFQGVSFVRNVAPNKNMFRVTFRLTDDILFARKAAPKRPAVTEDQAPQQKLLCTSQDDE